MSTPFDLQATLERLEGRLDAIDKKVDTMSATWRKAMEWIGQMGEHVQSLDDFREEVRASLEPLFQKLDNVDDVMRIIRHATSDVSRRIEEIEQKRRLAG
jgi:chromosome segregation ATPase